MKNAVFIVDIKENNHIHDFSQYCISTWTFWSKKNNVEFFVLKKPFHAIANKSPHLQKYFAFESLRENGIDAEKVAIVDSDTMIRWDCPDFFKVLSGNFQAVLDDELPKWTTRSIQAYQDLFPRTQLNWWEYFNSGFMIVEKETAPSLKDFVDFILSVESEIINIHNTQNLKVGFDQTLFNFFIKKKNIPITFLPKIFNFYHLQRKKILKEKEFIDLAYIWHFNGIKHSEREQHMSETWNKIQHHYQ